MILSALTRSFTILKSVIKTEIDGNFIRLSCWDENDYFPTYNGSDPLNEIECTENGWSLPADMKQLYCEHVFCPPIPAVGEEVHVECRERDYTCVSSKPYAEDINDEVYHDCYCENAEYSCKKEGFNYLAI